MRLFVASFFDELLVNEIKEIVLSAGDGAGAVRWVKPQLCHLTYAFLGERDGHENEAKQLHESLGGVRRFRISLGGLGAFPSLERPSVLWLSVREGAAELAGIASRVSGLLPAGEPRDFVPHITLGRVKGGLDGDFTARLVRAAATTAVSTVTSVDLVSSVLTEAGPVYDKVYTRKLL